MKRRTLNKRAQRAEDAEKANEWSFGVQMPMDPHWIAHNSGLATTMRQLMDLLCKLGHVPPMVPPQPPVIADYLRSQQEACRRPRWWKRLWPNFGHRSRTVVQSQDIPPVIAERAQDRLKQNYEKSN